VAEQKVRQCNLLFFTSPHLWSVWPFLPLVRRLPGKEEEYGLLFDTKKTMKHWACLPRSSFATCFWMPPTVEEFLALPKETYDTPEEIADAGWLID